MMVATIDLIIVTGAGCCAILYLGNWVRA